MPKQRNEREENNPMNEIANYLKTKLKNLYKQSFPNNANYTKSKRIKTLSNTYHLEAEKLK